MNNHANPIVIEDDSSQIHVHNPLDDDKEEEVVEEEDTDMEDDDRVICVGKVCFDKNDNLVEQNGNFCLPYPNCLVHKLPTIKNTH